MKAFTKEKIYEAFAQENGFDIQEGREWVDRVTESIRGALSRNRRS